MPRVPVHSGGKANFNCDVLIYEHESWLIAPFCDAPHRQDLCANLIAEPVPDFLKDRDCMDRTHLSRDRKADELIGLVDSPEMVSIGLARGDVFRSVDDV